MDVEPHVDAHSPDVAGDVADDDAARCRASNRFGRRCGRYATKDGLCVTHGGQLDMREVRARKGKQKPEVSDRDTALEALRRSLTSGNAAAVVASARALLDLAPAQGTADWAALTGSAREALAERIQGIVERRASYVGAGGGSELERLQERLREAELELARLRAREFVEAGSPSSPSAPVPVVVPPRPREPSIGEQLAKAEHERRFD